MITASPLFGHDVDDTDGLHPDPIALMLAWLPENETELRPLAALGTIGADGIPTVRHVLISDRDAEGVYFHTDANSRKVAELEAHPVAAMTIAWPDVGRQLAVRGDVERLDAAQAAQAYRRRSRYLQLLAWQNTAAQAALPAADRRAAWAEFDRDSDRLEPPAAWVGFRIRPRTITFWRGDPDGPSNRHEYALGADGWSATVLPG